MSNETIIALGALCGGIGAFATYCLVAYFNIGGLSIV